MDICRCKTHHRGRNGHPVAAGGQKQDHDDIIARRGCCECEGEHRAADGGKAVCELLPSSRRNGHTGRAIWGCVDEVRHWGC